MDAISSNSYSVKRLFDNLTVVVFITDYFVNSFTKIVLSISYLVSDYIHLTKMISSKTLCSIMTDVQFNKEPQAEITPRIIAPVV